MIDHCYVDIVIWCIFGHCLC